MKNVSNLPRTNKGIDLRNTAMEGLEAWDHAWENHFRRFKIYNQKKWKVKQNEKHCKYLKDPITL